MVSSLNPQLWGDQLVRNRTKPGKFTSHRMCSHVITLTQKQTHIYTHLNRYFTYSPLLLLPLLLQTKRERICLGPIHIKHLHFSDSYLHSMPSLCNSPPFKGSTAQEYFIYTLVKNWNIELGPMLPSCQQEVTSEERVSFASIFLPLQTPTSYSALTLRDVLNPRSSDVW